MKITKADVVNTLLATAAILVIANHSVILFKRITSE